MKSIARTKEKEQDKDPKDPENVFNKLVTLRRDIAERAGVVPRGIISDVSLKKIAMAMPDNEIELRRVSGISQIFVQKFSKIFLAEIAKIKSSPVEQKLSKVASDVLKLYRSGLKFQEIASRLFNKSIPITANYVNEVIDSGYQMNREDFVEDAIYNKIKSILVANPEKPMREIQNEIDIELDLQTLRMIGAFIKKEIRESISLS